MAKNCYLYALVFLLLAAHAHALPVESAVETVTEAKTPEESATTVQPIIKEITTTSTPTIIATTAKAEVTTEEELESAASENKPYIGTVGSQVALPEDMDVSASGFNPTVYDQLLPPGAFQHYLNQYGAAAAAAFAPYAGAYPAPIGYAAAQPPAPTLYPSPYVVQTGYEGYLVPSTSTDSTTTTTTTAATATTTAASNTGLVNPITFLMNLFSQFMMSTLFRVVAAIVSTITMMFFGRALKTVICTYTPICDISMNTVTYLRGHATAEDMGRMLAEGLTPERVRRTTEFVRNAIRKYRQLQQLVAEDGNGKNE